MDDLVYKKPSPVKEGVFPSKDSPSLLIKQPNLPSLEQIQELQRGELFELAQVRYGLKGSPFEMRLSPIELHPSMSQSAVTKLLLTVPEPERADQILFALAKGTLSSQMANDLLSGLELLKKLHAMKLQNKSDL